MGSSGGCGWGAAALPWMGSAAASSSAAHGEEGLVEESRTGRERGQRGGWDAVSPRLRDDGGLLHFVASAAEAAAVAIVTAVVAK
jgi:hypothetical protein